jgi:hypothetical protein
MAVRRLLAICWFGVERFVVDRAKAGWFDVLRLLGIIKPTLSWSGVEPRVEPGTINLRRWPESTPRTTYSPPPRASEGADDVMRILRRRAAWDLFDWFGVEQVPVAYWRILQTIPDPTDALAAFVRQLGLAPDKVRRLDPAELAVFRNYAAFICQLEGRPDSATEKQRLELERMFYFGDIDEAKAALEVFAGLNDALEAFEASPGPPRFRVFELLAVEIRALRDRGTRITRADAAEAVSLAQQYAKAMRHFDEARKTRAQVLEAISAHWDSWLASEEEARVRDGMIAKGAALEVSLLSDAGIDVGALLEEFELCIRDLGSLVEELARRARKARESAAAEEARRRAEGRRREREEHESTKGKEKSRDWRGREAHSMSWSELLGFFGFEAGDKPSLKELRDVFKRKAQECFPYPGSPDYRARNERYRQLLDVFKRLKSGVA